MNRRHKSTIPKHFARAGDRAKLASQPQVAALKPGNSVIEVDVTSQGHQLLDDYHGKSLERLEENRDSQAAEPIQPEPHLRATGLPSARKSGADLSGFVSMYEARRARMEKERNVQKLHNRIALLEKEEDKANRRIEETRKRAYDMIQSKIEKDNFNRKIT